MILKYVCLGCICIVSVKICFKAIRHLQSLANLRFLLPPLILRLYTGCRLDQNFSKSIIGFQRVKVQNHLGYKCPSFLKLLQYSFCECVRNIPKIVMFVNEKMKLVSFSLFLDILPPPPPRPKTYFGQLNVII